MNQRGQVQTLPPVILGPGFIPNRLNFLEGELRPPLLSGRPRLSHRLLQKRIARALYRPWLCRLSAGLSASSSTSSADPPVSRSRCKPGPTIPVRPARLRPADIPHTKAPRARLSSFPPRFALGEEKKTVA